MSDRERDRRETLMQASLSLAGIPLNDADLSAVAGLLHGLAGDMTAFRALEVGDDQEPATIYHAVDQGEEQRKEQKP